MDIEKNTDLKVLRIIANSVIFCAMTVIVTMALSSNETHARGTFIDQSAKSGFYEIVAGGPFEYTSNGHTYKVILFRGEGHIFEVPLANVNPAIVALHKYVLMSADGTMIPVKRTSLEIE